MGLMVEPTGIRFDRFDPAALEQRPWGRLQVRFLDCDHAQLSWQALDPAWGEGELPLARLTRPVGLGDCGLD